MEGPRGAEGLKVPKTEPAHPRDPCEHGDDHKEHHGEAEPADQDVLSVILITPPAGTATRSGGSSPRSAAMTRAGVACAAAVIRFTRGWRRSKRALRRCRVRARA